MPHPPFIILDEKSDLPLYRQIYETIRRSILGGEFHSGKQLPASRFLAKQLGVSRMTVINAYDQLTAEGYLESRTGAGTYVARQLPEEFLNTPAATAGVKQKGGFAQIPRRTLELSKYGLTLEKESFEILRFNTKTPLAAFQHGLAAVDKFPFDVWMKIANKVYRTLERNAFGYGEPAGFAPLRAAIAAHLKSTRAVNCTPEQIIITSGAQHAFDLIGRVLLESKTEVFVEEPGYFGVKQAFQTFGAKLTPVPVDRSGFNLAAALEKSFGAKLAYVTPSHQFPLGVTMTLARRLALLEWVKKIEGWIIEDDYDSEFRYEGHPLPSLQGLDRNGRVLYVGTFAKTVFPALKIGCLVVPPDLIEIFTAARAVSGMQAPLVEQATLAEFISEGHFNRHIRRMRRLYEERQELLVAEVKKHLSGKLEVERSVSGMHIIGWLPEGVEDKLVAERVARVGIKTATLSDNSLTRPERGGLILGYTAIDETQIKQGVKHLAEAMNDLDKK